jgi:hypothetical protein
MKNIRSERLVMLGHLGVLQIATKLKRGAKGFGEEERGPDHSLSTSRMPATPCSQLRTVFHS